MLIHNEQNTSTAIGAGDINFNTASLRGMCKQIIVRPGSESVIYSISFTNESDSIIYVRENEIGTLSEVIELPVKGIYTVSIYDITTSSQTFVTQLMIEE